MSHIPAKCKRSKIPRGQSPVGTTISVRAAAPSTSAFYILALVKWHGPPSLSLARRGDHLYEHRSDKQRRTRFPLGFVGEQSEPEGETFADAGGKFLWYTDDVGLYGIMQVIIYSKWSRIRAIFPAKVSHIICRLVVLKISNIINNALDTYRERTKQDLLTHPLAARLQACDTPAAILTILRDQIHGLYQSQSNSERWSKWLDPTVNVLFAFSATIGAGVGRVFSPASVIFTGVGVLLSAAKDVRASQNTVLDIFERIEMFFRRLEVYTEVEPTPEMVEMMVQITVEVLSTLGIATKEIKQGRTKKYMKRLIGRTDMGDALKKLDKLTHEEARMAIAQNLKATHNVDERVRGVANRVEAVDKG
ncbi:hypothetical protein BGY98DRAFT_1174804 [Russula aff. rugulosa BPL654]|nr:hypothetical protein BGY98DRAFT_1174804 [Russula aff. rugulosa BPL654]